MADCRVFLLAGGIRGRSRSQSAKAAEAFERLGCTRPHVAYVGAASDDNPDFFSWIREWLVSAGARDVRLAPLCGSPGEIGEARSILNGADIVFVSGGDVEAGMSRLSETGMVRELASIFSKGVPFMGVSAGSIMLCREWVRWPDPSDERRIERFPCLGLVDALCDTHGESDGWSELASLLTLCPDGTLGHGIATGGAVCIDSHRRLQPLWKPLHMLRRDRGEVTRLPDVPPTASSRV
jgi:peptidase E